MSLMFPLCFCRRLNFHHQISSQWDQDLKLSATIDSKHEAWRLLALILVSDTIHVGASN